MKKFLVIIFLFIGLYFIFDAAYYRWGFYIPSNREIEVISYTDENSIYMKENNKFNKVTIKGVNVGSFFPNHYITDYSVSYDTYYKWLEQISEMGANVVRINTVYNDDFYNAFYDYNKEHKEKLYLLQGIQLDSYALNARFDAYSDKFYGELVNQAEDAVDVVHGRKKLTMSKFGEGTYKKDISKYVLGYIVGSEWVDDTIAYTDEMRKDKVGFKGDYLKTSEDATAFETMLAKVMDHMIGYETRKYRSQHAISFINTPETDPVTVQPIILGSNVSTEQPEDKDNQIVEETLTPDTLQYSYHKIVDLSIEHILTTDNYKGLFASYNVSPYYPDYLSYEKQKYEDTYYSYLKKLTDYHKMPVVITEFAYSTSRGVSTHSGNIYGEFGGMTEEEQGNALVKTYQTILKSGSVGGIISSWTDQWDKRSWNTIEKVTLTEATRWGDVQTSNQGVGILSFDPGEKKSVCYVDGDSKEWKKKNVIYDDDNYTLSMKQDEKYLYFMIKNKKKTNSKIYIPIDVTPNSGSKKSDIDNLTFNRPVDFLVTLDGNKGKIYVQEYYNVLEAVDGYELKNRNSYVNPPSKDSSKFEDINLLISSYGTSKFSMYYKQSVTYPTGILRYGNANPDAENYDSLADFYSNDNIIELRLPWQILNFSSPAESKIHDDYYKKYGVEDMEIDEIYVGVSSDKNIKLSKYELESWQDAEYHERLKKSYYIIKDYWKEVS